MVRAPCCEKMGLKKGPWTPEEDQVLVSYIQRYGHGNWRALPKQAGLLRCGKSCRLRWTNYLRPDIKRGNFSTEEEDDIIKLHEMLGNRWSAIAARLPGRTDNEIKNVWHTHLKKRLKQNQSKCESINNTSSTQQDSIDIQPLQGNDNQDYAAVSPQPSSSDFSSATDCSIVTTVENPEMVVSMDNYSSSSDNFLDIDNLLSESLWTENYHETAEDFSSPIADSSMDDAMDFWYDLFMKAGEISELPQL